MNTNFRRALLVTGLVVMLGGISSWGALPPNNDTSDLRSNTGGGTGALISNSTGFNNTAYGVFGLENNTTGSANTVSGSRALQENTTGNNNTASGMRALHDNTTGNSNTALGYQALQKSTGNSNIAIGTNAGLNLKGGSSNIYLGNAGVASESKTMRLGSNQTRTFIAGIAGTRISGSTVVIKSNGQLGTIISSARYKKDIQDMGEQSRKVLELRPVSFHYQQDPEGQQQYGLIAEEVDRVYPELVTHTAAGEAESIQYHALIPMLLNELQRQQRQLAELKVQNAALAERLARLEKGGVQPALTSR